MIKKLDAEGILSVGVVILVAVLFTMKAFYFLG
jgi:hypothetical protein